MVQNYKKSQYRPNKYQDFLQQRIIFNISHKQNSDKGTNEIQALKPDTTLWWGFSAVFWGVRRW